MLELKERWDAIEPVIQHMIRAGYVRIDKKLYKLDVHGHVVAFRNEDLEATEASMRKLIMFNVFRRQTI